VRKFVLEALTKRLHDYNKLDQKSFAVSAISLLTLRYIYNEKPTFFKSISEHGTHFSKSKNEKSNVFRQKKCAAIRKSIKTLGK